MQRCDKFAQQSDYFCFHFETIQYMSKQKKLFEEEGGTPTNPQQHLPFWLPVLQSKDKKKCCKKYKDGKRCKKCPKR